MLPKNVPALHGVQFEDELLPEIVEKEPEEHAVHADKPVKIVNYPAGHGVQDVIPIEGANEPEAHGLQVAWPSEE